MAYPVGTYRGSYSSENLQDKDVSLFTVHVNLHKDKNKDS